MFEDEAPNADFVNSLPAWQQYTQTDNGSLEADPLLDSTFHPLPSSCSPVFFSSPSSLSLGSLSSWMDTSLFADTDFVVEDDYDVQSRLASSSSLSISFVVGACSQIGPLNFSLSSSFPFVAPGAVDVDYRHFNPIGKLFPPINAASIISRPSFSIFTDPYPSTIPILLDAWLIGYWGSHVPQLYIVSPTGQRSVCEIGLIRSFGFDSLIHHSSKLCFSFVIPPLDLSSCASYCSVLFSSSSPSFVVFVSCIHSPVEELERCLPPMISGLP